MVGLAIAWLGSVASEHVSVDVCVDGQHGCPKQDDHAPLRVQPLLQVQPEQADHALLQVQSGAEVKAARARSLLSPRQSSADCTAAGMKSMQNVLTSELTSQVTEQSIELFADVVLGDLGMKGMGPVGALGGSVFGAYLSEKWVPDPNEARFQAMQDATICLAKGVRQNAAAIQSLKAEVDALKNMVMTELNKIKAGVTEALIQPAKEFVDYFQDLSDTSIHCMSCLVCKQMPHLYGKLPWVKYDPATNCNEGGLVSCKDDNEDCDKDAFKLWFWSKEFKDKLSDLDYTMTVIRTGFPNLNVGARVPGDGSIYLGYRRVQHSEMLIFANLVNMIKLMLTMIVTSQPLAETWANVLIMTMHNQTGDSDALNIMKWLADFYDALVRIPFHDKGMDGVGGQYQSGTIIENLGELWRVQNSKAEGTCGCWGQSHTENEHWGCGYVSDCRRPNDNLRNNGNCQCWGIFGGMIENCTGDAWLCRQEAAKLVSTQDCQARDVPYRCGCVMPRGTDYFGEAAYWSDLGGGCYSINLDGTQSYLGYTFHSIEMARRWSKLFNPYKWSPRRDILIPPGIFTKVSGWCVGKVDGALTDVDSCKKLCQDDSSCIGVSVTSPTWLVHSPGDTRCGLCKTNRAVNADLNWDTYLKPDRALPINMFNKRTGVWCAGKVDGAHMRSDHCQTLCEEDNGCIGVSVTSDAYVRDHPGDTRCGICRHSRQENADGNWDTYWHRERYQAN